MGRNATAAGGGACGRDLLPWSPQSGVAQWQSIRLLIEGLWVRVPPPESSRAAHGPPVVVLSPRSARHRVDKADRDDKLDLAAGEPVFSSNPIGFTDFGGSGEDRGSLIALLASAALVAAGCGGASDESGGDSASASSGDGSGGSLSLVAYSTPQVVYDEIIPDFNEDARRRGRRVQDVVRRVRRPVARRGGGPAGRRRDVLDRAGHDAPRRRRARRTATGTRRPPRAS